MKRLFLSIALLVTVQAFSQNALSNNHEDDLDNWYRLSGGTSLDTVRARFKIDAPKADGTIDPSKGFREKGFVVLLKEITYSVNPSGKNKNKGVDYTLVKFLDENKQPLPKGKIVWDYLLY